MTIYIILWEKMQLVFSMYVWSTKKQLLFSSQVWQFLGRLLIKWQPKFKRGVCDFQCTCTGWSILSIYLMQLSIPLSAWVSSGCSTCWLVYIGSKFYENPRRQGREYWPYKKVDQVPTDSRMQDYCSSCRLAYAFEERFQGWLSNLSQFWGHKERLVTLQKKKKKKRKVLAPLFCL